MTGQQVQNPKFQCRQLNRIALERLDLVRIFVDHQGANVQDIWLIIGQIAFTPPQQGLDPGHDLQRIERLGDIIVSPRDQALNLVHVRCLGRNHQNWNG